jgi:hypothetical protein
VDDDRIIAVRVENDDLEQLNSMVRPDDEHAVDVSLSNLMKWQAHGVGDVAVGNSVLAGTFRDLHAT